MKKKLEIIGLKLKKYINNQVLYNKRSRKRNSLQHLLLFYKKELNKNNANYLTSSFQRNKKKKEVEERTHKKKTI